MSKIIYGIAFLSVFVKEWGLKDSTPAPLSDQTGLAQDTISWVLKLKLYNISRIDYNLRR